MTGWEAHYAVTNPDMPEGHPGRHTNRHLPVAYWDEGAGWVSFAMYTDRALPLLRAHEAPFRNWEFTGYHRRPQPVGVLPGGGWSVRYSGLEGEEGGVDPLLAWLVYDDATVRAIDVGTDGYAFAVDEVGNFDRLVPPNEGSPS